MDKKIPSGSDDRQSADTVEGFSSIMKAAGVNPQEIPCLAILKEGLRELEGAQQTEAAEAVIDSTMALANLGLAEEKFRNLSCDYGLPGFADAARIIGVLRLSLIAGDKARLKQFLKAARDAAGGRLSTRQHESLREMAAILDTALRKEKGSPRQLFSRAVSWLPIYAPGLCPLRTRRKAAWLGSLLSRGNEPSFKESLTLRKHSRLSAQLKKAKDGEALVRLAAQAHGVSNERDRKSVV